MKVKTVLGATSLFVGLFFLIAGVWYFFFGPGTHPPRLEYLTMVFGGLLIIVGISLLKMG